MKLGVNLLKVTVNTFRKKDLHFKLMLYFDFIYFFKSKHPEKITISTKILSSATFFNSNYKNKCFLSNKSSSSSSSSWALLSFHYMCGHIVGRDVVPHRTTVLHKYRYNINTDIIQIIQIIQISILDAEISALHNRDKLHFQMDIKTESSCSKLYQYFTILLFCTANKSNKCSLGEQKRLLSKCWSFL